jgi:hypothetical protein
MKLPRLIVTLLFLCTAASAASPSSINNDDSCDIKVGPAATLLLPYFQVDTDGPSGRTTLFTITNVSRYPQIAHVTLWTDWAYPVMTFNLFLTGYDVQAINLADVLVRDVIAPPSGTTSATAPGALSASGNGNLRTPLDCAGTPGLVPESIMSAVRFALRAGLIRFPDLSCNNAGSAHFDAIGYATIDVVASCTARMPSDPLYYTNDLLFDNVLIGDYQQIGANPAGRPPEAFDAAGNPMVHIRAMPEGGGAGADVGTALPYTFYDRYTPASRRTFDRRQPLPSTFATRFVQGGTPDFSTNLTIWREGIGTVTCAISPPTSQMVVPEIVRFDEHENPYVFGECVELPGDCPVVLPATSSTNTKGLNYPSLGGSDVGGWIYINANNGGSTTYSVTQNIGGVPVPTNARTALAPVGSTTTVGPRPSQNWITISMFGTLAGNHITAELDAAPLGNGCTPAAFQSTGRFVAALLPGAPPIGPAGGAFVCPPGTTLTNGTTALCTGTNTNPPP